MLFARREKQGFRQRLRAWVWPRRSWRRSLAYFRSRVLRLHATPHAIAAGIAAGVFSSFTPFLGFHFFIAMGLAWLIAGSIPASILGTFFGNPLTFPFIWASTFEFGRWLTAGDVPASGSPVSLGQALGHGDLFALWKPYIEPMLVGSLPLGFGAALAAYALAYVGAREFQAARAARRTIRTPLS